MQAPEIRYTRTSDGVNIAYSRLGQGPPIVASGLPFSHLRAEWEIPATRTMIETMSQVATYVRFDHRGFGMSDRDVSDFSLDALVRDLEAVMDKVGAEPCTLIGMGASSPSLLAYAARHLDRVARVVLIAGSDGARGLKWDQWETLAEMAKSDWQFASEAMLRTIYGWESEQARSQAALLRESIAPESLAVYLRCAREWDARPLVADVSVPTLLVDIDGSELDEMRALASRLPDARVAVTSGHNWEERFAEIGSAVAQFLFGDAQIFETDAVPSGTAVILFTDIADSTGLTEQLGDSAFRAASRALDDGVRAAIREAGGTPVAGKVLGDGVMGVFASAAQAIAAARRCVELSRTSELPLHIGVHAGDVIREADNVYGGAVNIASRICGLCDPGEILVSQTVRDLARTSAGVTFEDRGEHALKGIADPVRVFAVSGSHAN
jgi:class 3 adenylate cyclase